MWPEVTLDRQAPFLIVEFYEANVLEDRTVLGNNFSISLGLRLHHREVHDIVVAIDLIDEVVDCDKYRNNS